MRILSLLFSPKDNVGGAGSEAELTREQESLRQANEADDDGAPAAGAPRETIASAGQKYLESLSAEDRDREFTDEELEQRGGETDGAEDEEAVERRREAEGSDVDEPITRDDGAEWNESARRWVKDGKFVEGEAPEGPEPAPRKPAAATVPAKKPDAVAGKPKTEQEPKLQKITLAGEADRKEEDIELEVDDEIAERIKRLTNGAMRRQQFERRKAELDARQDELEAIDLQLDQDPVGFIIRQLTPERQLEVARALLVTQMPNMQDILAKFLDEEGGENARLREQLDLNTRMSESEKKLERARQGRAHAKKCMDAAAALVPGDADDDVAQEFMVDARRVLQEAAAAGTRVTPETVKEILARRIKLYGFDQPRRPAAPRRDAAPSRDRRETTDDTRTARPLSQRAREIADRRAPTREAAAATQARLRRVQQSRTASQRQAPAGAGAALTEVPIFKPEEETDVRSASKALRQRGLPESWTGAQ